MKKLSSLLILTFGLAIIVHAQKATLNISIKNSTANSCYLWIPAKSLRKDYFNHGSKDIALKNGKSMVTIDVTRPVFAYLAFQDSRSENAKNYAYKLYLANGYNLNFNADATYGNITVSGTGSNNNQPLLGKINSPDPQKLYGDTLPNRIIALANHYQKQLQTAYAQYLKKYKPSADFVKSAKEEAKYSALQIYYGFKENNKYQIRKAYASTQPVWQRVQDSLLSTTKLNNDAALGTMSYPQFLRDFLLREKERLWQEADEYPTKFYKDYYDADTADGKKLFNADAQNLLTEKIINKHFTGAVAETAYAMLIDEALSESNPKNLVSIYDRFSKRYPNSEYRSLFRPAIEDVRRAEANPLTSDMVFLPQNGTDLKSFKDILTLAKGKTVLLDMWGTWCGPCREEISENSAAIKSHFKNKGVDYFYVANYDLDHTNEWKKLIAYFDMKGTHVLASNDLNKDIMKTVKGDGYPTYVIIKKDGSWELSKACYPMNRDVLIKQLEAALAL